jgi:hypothetical protein
MSTLLAVAFHLQLLQVGRQARSALWYGAMLRLVKPWKLRYQTSSRPRRTGRFCASGAVRKCWSMACAPASSSRKPWAPMAMAIGRPMADHSE